MNNYGKLLDRVEKQIRRMKQAEKDRPTLLAQTVYLGTLGVIFVLPVIAGAYLGLWLDTMSPGYSVRWTVGMIFLGVIVGAVNVYHFVKG
jgi:ATP synthase protein I